ncbi:MAG: BACON domain-containing protein [Bacteroidaceae bacterium]|nr:BACON domain-containing protein [Bacteroidaceae bacterium]
MKRIYWIFFALAAVFQSCSNSDGNHHLGIIYPVPYTLCYADDTQDSLIFGTMDSWKSELNQPWARFEGGVSTMEGTVVNDDYTIWVIRNYFDMEENNTQETRVLRAYVTANGVKVSATYVQYPIFHFLRPDPLIVNDKVSPLELTASGQKEKDSLVVFMRRPWKLEKNAEADWLTLSQTSGNGGGTEKVLLSFSKLPVEKRQATLTLTSGTVKNTITFVQEKE